MLTEVEQVPATSLVPFCVHIFMRAFATLLAIFCFCWTGRGSEPSHVLLRFGDAPELNEGAKQQLAEKSLAIIKSSNFNSATHTNILTTTTVPKVQADYRATIVDRHLVVSFATPQQVDTAGGNTSVYEIVIGLSNSQIAGPIFTVDASGRIISHAKYSGPLCMELMDYVRELTKLK